MPKETGSSPGAPPAETPDVLPRPDFHFQGEIGRTYLDSDPAQFPQAITAPKGAPNVLLVLIDDCGFGQYGTFGGGIPSPTMEDKAEGMIVTHGGLEGGYGLYLRDGKPTFVSNFLGADRPTFAARGVVAERQSHAARRLQI
jgi:hypothetical protein